MEYIKNIVESNPIKLDELVSIKENQIVSMAISKVENAQITLFVLAGGELISEEAYPGDTLYHVLSGEVMIQWESDNCKAVGGEIVAIPANTCHSLAVTQDSKLMQITINR